MSIRENIDKTRSIIEAKSVSLGIKNNIAIVAVTKNMPSSYIVEASQAGLSHIGENRVQEAEKKFEEIKSLHGITKHMLGHLQGNKAPKAAMIFDMVQSIDSLETAGKLDRKCSELGKVMPVLIEVNTSGEASKSGVKPELAEELAAGIAELGSLKLSGLMTVGPLTDDEASVRRSFKLLYKLREKLSQAFSSVKEPVLSMGMSGDFEIAIEEGSNMVRLGRILFGERNAD